jgi:putative membrane protein
VRDEQEPDPRYLLANERTLLAWIRTALALVAGGLAAEQLLPAAFLGAGGRVLGVALVGFGAAIGVGGYRRWVQVQRALRSARPLPATALPLLLTLGTVAVAVVAALLILSGPR